MENLYPTSDLNTSHLSILELQHLVVTVAQKANVRLAQKRNRVIILNAQVIPLLWRFPGIWQLLGFTDKGRFIFVALRYDDNPGKFAALGIKVAGTVAEVRHYLCHA